MSSHKEILQKKLDELPKQIGILLDAYQSIANESDKTEKVDDLLKYKKRMEDGIHLLLELQDEAIINTIEKIRTHSPNLLRENKERYLEALRKYRKVNGIQVDSAQIKECIHLLKSAPLMHTTKQPGLVKADGIVPSAALWLTENKSCANAMDIALGLDGCVFLTHGFTLPNFGDDFVTVRNNFLDDKDTLVTSLDLFTFVLIKTGRTAPTAIATKEWISVLGDYAKNIFAGQDFWRIKAEYILTFFASIDEFNSFAKTHFYINQITKAPSGEYPFLGEIKVFKSVSPQQID